MAKVINENGKKVVSISAIFKKPSRKPVPADRLIKTEPGKVIKSSKRPKTKLVPQHPLATRFSDTVKNSREHIQTSALAHYHTGYKAVSHNLKDTEEDSNKLEQLRLYSHKELSAPLKDEEFQQFAKGKSLGPTTLGQRMKILEQTLNREEEELQRQWEEYQAVETELESLAAEIGISNGTNLSAVQASKFFGAMGTEMQKGLEIEKARFVEMMLQHGKESLKRMKASEKELNFQQKKNQNFILKMFENEW